MKKFLIFQTAYSQDYNLGSNQPSEWQEHTADP